MQQLNGIVVYLLGTEVGGFRPAMRDESAVADDPVIAAIYKTCKPLIFGTYRMTAAAFLCLLFLPADVTKAVNAIKFGKNWQGDIPYKQL